MLPWNGCAHVHEHISRLEKVLGPRKCVNRETVQLMKHTNDSTNSNVSASSNCSNKENDNKDHSSSVATNERNSTNYINISNSNRGGF